MNLVKFQFLFKMKIIFTLTHFLCCLAAFAVNGEGRPERPKYVVKSDVVDSSVAVGNCLVQGRVVDWYSNPVSNGTIATKNRSVAVHTDSEGLYSMMLSDKDTSIFFYHPQHGEVIIWRYKFKSQHRVSIDFYPSTYELHQNVKKPVIYLYDDAERDYDIKLENTSITYLYPDCEDAWRVNASANGQLTDLTTNKTYPYLFWEGERKDLTYQQQRNQVYGNLVASDSLTLFLENSLESMGLNTKEKIDFITYWVPVLLKSESVFVQFLIDEDYTSNVAAINVCPFPDCQRRVFMLFTPVNNNFLPFDFRQQEFFGFERAGATLIEWGGSEIEFLVSPD